MEKGRSADGSATSDAKTATRAGTYPTAPVQGDPVDPASGTGQTLPQRVRVSQGVTQAMLIRQVAPVYPPEARRRGIQGNVLMRAVIGKDGNIQDLQLISGPKELVQAAVGAVQQWRYKPYTFMGQPVEVDTQIQVNFRLSR